LSEQSDPEFPHKLDLVWLYRRFTDRRYNIYYKEMSKFQINTVGAEGIKERDFIDIQTVGLG
jgi:hypothetical protein